MIRERVGVIPRNVNYKAETVAYNHRQHHPKVCVVNRGRGEIDVDVQGCGCPTKFGGGLGHVATFSGRGEKEALGGDQQKKPAPARPASVCCGVVEKGRRTLVEAHVHSIFHTICKLEKDAKDERAKRLEVRRKYNSDMVAWCVGATVEELYEEFPSFKKCICATVDMEKIDKEKVILVTKELVLRSSKDDPNAKACPFTEDPRYVEYARVLEFNIGQELANLLVEGHIMFERSLYSNTLLGAFWLVGLGYEHFDATNGFNEGIFALQRRIDRGEIHYMAVYSQLLKLHGLVPLPYRYLRDGGPGDDQALGFDKFLAKLLATAQNYDQKARGERQSRSYVELSSVRKWCESEKMIEDEADDAQVYMLVERIQKLATYELHEMLKTTLCELDKSSGNVFKYLGDVELRELIKFAEETKMRFMYLGGKFKGEELFTVDCSLYELYVPVLTINLGPKAAEALLALDRGEGYSIYENVDSIATWLIGLGFWRHTWKTLAAGMEELSKEIREGSFDPMPALASLLEAHDLAWPPQSTTYKALHASRDVTTTDP
ncbi:hypothetical protein HOP50_20g85570 [Chloropicon primus]|uniref:Uncharacterized protein n=1 Tax=Chloropicon primus TaxID=1764295 RepID=A0A5B8N148_9CHLO|nr:hypothetical protein A3770_20p85240 [Chloropicon primus]UPR05207.1 hypothetical protein HOP50_20g85570 [Chloropicon primus]|eukprot:QDZ26006.1 hypothetical protein A3770_20p85240 [Chloropicon primus]